MKVKMTALWLPVALLMMVCGTVRAEEAERPPALEGSMEKISYSIGMQIARSLLANDMELDIDILIRGLSDQYTGGPTLLSEREVMDVQRAYMAEQESQREEAGRVNRRRSREFLEENRTRDSVRVTESGLQYKVIKAGAGRSPEAFDTARIHYVGRTIDGDIFDSSRARGEPAVFPLQGIVAGLSEGLQLMEEGATYFFYLPSELAYGEDGAGTDIGPNEALIFEVELLEVIDGD